MLLSVMFSLHRCIFLPAKPAGPEAMTHAVQLEVAGMNGCGRSGPYYTFSALAHTM
jgi:hypothetical protein